MNFKDEMLNKIAAVEAEKNKAEQELKVLEEEFANVKLNPYGITAIDFTKRQELSSDLLKMEGCIMGLNLAVETYDQSAAA